VESIDGNYPDDHEETDFQGELNADDGKLSQATDGVPLPPPPGDDLAAIQ
jgi:hypothetical protein